MSDGVSIYILLGMKAWPLSRPARSEAANSHPLYIGKCQEYSITAQGALFVRSNDRMKV